MTSKTYSFRAIGALGGATALWLAISALGDLALAWASVVNLIMAPSLMEGPLPEGAMALLVGANMMRLPTVLLHLGVHVICAVWLYRASLNAHALAGGLTISPAWAVGWYFVPVANLWKPYQAVAEIWRASTVSEAWRTVAVPRMLLVWWIVWLVNRALEIFPPYIQALSGATYPLTMTLLLNLVASLTGMVSCLMLMSIVQVITALQTCRDQAGVF